MGERTLQEMISDFLPQHPQGAAQDMMATTGRELRRSGDIGAFGYVDNLARSLRHAGQIMLDLMTEGAVGSMEPVVQVKGCNGPAGPTINWAAFERNAWRQKCERLEAERAVLLAGVEELRLRIFALEAIVEVNRHTRDKGESDDRDAALLRAVKQM